MLEHSGENSIEYLKNQIALQKNHIDELELDKANGNIQFKEIQSKMSEQEEAFEEEIKSIIDQLRFLLEFIEVIFADIKEDSPEEKLQQPENKPQNDAVNLCLNEIKKFIVGIKGGITKSWKLMEKENMELKNELIETRVIKEDIVNEVSKVKNIIQHQEKGIKEKQNENIALVGEVNSMRDNLKIGEKKILEIQQQNNETFREIYNKLFELFSKYEGVDFVINKLNNKPSMELAMYPKSTLLQMISIIGEITNALNLEIKSLNIKILDLTEEVQKLHKSQNELIEESQKFEQFYNEEKLKAEK